MVRLRTSRRIKKTSFKQTTRNVLVFKPDLEVLEDRTLPSVFMVTETADGGAGSLRQAILDANANIGRDTISFNIGGSGPYSIRPLTPLPAIVDSVVIDGSTQPGYVSSPLVELAGVNLSPSDFSA